MSSDRKENPFVEKDKAIAPPKDKKSTVLIKPEALQKYKEANQRVQAKEYKQGLALYKAATKIDPGFEEAFRRQADCYLALNQFAKAIHLYDQALAINPNAYKAYHNRGACYMYLRQYDKAIKDFNETIRCNPVLIEAYQNLGLIYESKYHNAEEAIIYYNEVLKLNKHDALALARLKILCTEMEFKKSFTFHDKTHLAGELSQNTKALKYYHEANVYRDAKAYDKAIAAYQKAVLHDPQFDEAHRQIANCHMLGKQFEEAIPAYDRALKINSKNVKAYFNRAACQVALLRYTHAVADYTRAIALNPSEALFYNDRCSAYLALNENALALADAQMALSLDPTYLHALKNLRKVGSEEEVIQAYLLALKSKPQDPALNQMFKEVMGMKYTDYLAKHTAMVMQLDSCGFFSRGIEGVIADYAVSKEKSVIATTSSQPLKLF